MKKTSILIMFIACISLSINKSFAQQESVQDKLMKYKWVMACREDGPITVGYTTYTKTSYIYNMDDIGQEPAIAPYYLSRNMQSLSFNDSRVGKKINGKYLYTHIDNSLERPKAAYIFKILTLTDHMLELQLIVPDPITIIGPPSIRTYIAHPL